MSYPPPKGSFRDILAAGTVIPFTEKNTRTVVIGNWVSMSVLTAGVLVSAFAFGITTIWALGTILFGAGMVFFMLALLKKTILPICKYRESLYREYLEAQRTEAEKAEAASEQSVT